MLRARLPGASEVAGPRADLEEQAGGCHTDPANPTPRPWLEPPAPWPPHLMTMGTHSMLATLEVKGETTEASAWDSEMPTSAAFRAPQSLAPSPHMPTQYLTDGEGRRGRDSRAGSAMPHPPQGLAGGTQGWPAPYCLQGAWQGLSKPNRVGAQQTDVTTAGLSVPRFSIHGCEGLTLPQYIFSFLFFAF